PLFLHCFALDQILLETNYQGFPVVQDKKNMMLLGYIGRVELKYVIDKAKRVRGTSNSAHCFFNPEDTKYIDSSGSGEGSSNFIDFAPFIDQTPITVHPRLPLET
ncbi:6209_t:CDS:2, partial [Dentiscutata heterogama]